MIEEEYLKKNKNQYPTIEWDSKKIRNMQNYMNALKEEEEQKKQDISRASTPKIQKNNSSQETTTTTTTTTAYPLFVRPHPTIDIVRVDFHKQHQKPKLDRVKILRACMKVLMDENTTHEIDFHSQTKTIKIPQNVIEKHTKNESVRCSVAELLAAVHDGYALAKNKISQHSVARVLSVLGASWNLCNIPSNERQEEFTKRLIRNIADVAGHCNYSTGS
eukprot:168191-Rhodomonas_salina.1